MIHPWVHHENLRGLPVNPTFPSKNWDLLNGFLSAISVPSHHPTFPLKTHHWSAKDLNAELEDLETDDRGVFGWRFLLVGFWKPFSFCRRNKNGGFLDGEEMVQIQNFRFRNVFLFGDLIKAFVRGLEGGSSKDGFQTSFFSTSNLYGFAQYVLYFLPGFLFDIEIEKPWCIELIPACNNGGATTDELLFLPFWKVAILGGTQEKTAPWLTTSRCWHPLGGCPWGALVQNGTIPGEMNS